MRLALRFMHFGPRLRNAEERAVSVYPFTCTATTSGVHLDFLKDSETSMAVTLPINRARLRSSVVWMGLRSIRWTYSAHGAPIRLTFTTNFVYFMRTRRGFREKGRLQKDGCRQRFLCGQPIYLI